MVKRKKKEYPHTVISQFSSWESSYGLDSKESYDDYYFSERLEIFSKVIYSENKKIKNDDTLCFYIFVDHAMKSDTRKPELVSVFDHSRKCRTAGLTVHPSFLNNFRFLLSQNIKPYFSLTCINNAENRDILIRDCNIVSSVIIDDYKTC